jgi:hypothetical protein
MIGGTTAVSVAQRGWDVVAGMTAGWSARQMRRQVWLKWRLAESGEVQTLAATQLAAREVDHQPGRHSAEPLLAGLAALADGDLDTATAVLDAAARTGRHPECLTALGDVFATLGDRTTAVDVCRRALAARPTDPVAAIGAAVALSAQDSAAALDLLWPLHTARPDDPVVSYYLVHVLLRRSEDVSSSDRHGQPAIISASQLAECRWIVGQLTALGGGDEEATLAVAKLASRVAVAETWAWRRSGANWGTLALFVILAVLGMTFGDALSNMAVLVGSVLFGLMAVVLFVVTHRRPVWELLAQDLGSVVTRPDV